MYAEGESVSQDYAQALKWFRKAVERGDAMAQSGLAEMYRQGHGVPQDYAEAMKWYRKAADQGHSPAQFFLGEMYHMGQDVPQDYVLSHMWLNLGASKGYKSATKLRDLIAKEMTPADISKAQRRAREWVAAFEKRKKK